MIVKIKERNESRTFIFEHMLTFIETSEIILKNYRFYLTNRKNKEKKITK